MGNNKPFDDMTDFNPKPGTPEWDASLEEINEYAEQEAKQYYEDHKFDDPE